MGSPLVVADAGPVLHLHWVAASTWALPEEPVHIVEAVWQEIASFAPDSLHDRRLLRIPDPPHHSPLLTGWRLHAGEAAALTHGLREATRTEVIFLCDERSARLACRSLRLPVTGSLGLILQALRAGRVGASQARQALTELPSKGRLHLGHRTLAAALQEIDSIEGSDD